MPFLAYKNLADRGLADFKWLFLGDDDTLFMVDAAREVAKTLDPEMPIFLTGTHSSWDHDLQCR